MTWPSCYGKASCKTVVIFTPVSFSFPSAFWHHLHCLPQKSSWAKFQFQGIKITYCSDKESTQHTHWNSELLHSKCQLGPFLVWISEFSSDIREHKPVEHQRKAMFFWCRFPILWFDLTCWVICLNLWQTMLIIRWINWPPAC